MAGRRDRQDANSDFLTPFALYRENVNSINDSPYNEGIFSNITPIINLSESGSGILHNKICLIFKRLSGNKSSFTATLYCQLKDEGPLKDEAFVVNEEPNVEEDRIIVFNLLYAGVYKILLTDVRGGEYNIYESHFSTSVLGDNNRINL